MRKDDGTRWESERSKAFNIFQTKQKEKWMLMTNRMKYLTLSVDRISRSIQKCIWTIVKWKDRKLNACSDTKE